jgi:transcriptional regulator with XRE-family HTH domain
MESGLTQEDLAYRCGWDSQGRISNYERDLRTPGWEDLERISNALAKPLAWFFSTQTEGLSEEAGGERPQDEENDTFSGWHFPPVQGSALLQSDGTWVETAPRPDGTGETLAVPCQDPAAYALLFRGDSLQPTIHNGWLALLSPGQEPSPGELVLVQRRDGTGMIREFLWEWDRQVSLLDLRSGAPRATFQREEIGLLHPVTALLPPSQTRF